MRESEIEEIRLKFSLRGVTVYLYVIWIYVIYMYIFKEGSIW